MRRRWKIGLGVLGGAVVAAATAFQLSRTRYEEPSYETLEKEGSFEVRRYAPRVVAQTRVTGAEGDVAGEGFRRLAGYIFGGNQGDRSIAMTTPVERSPSAAEPTRIAMTTPVERAPSEDGWLITFTMPSEHTLDTLPLPNDRRVELRELPGETVAVLRFSGRAEVAAKNARTAELLAQLGERGYEPVGEASLAQYDPPWVLGMFRRNEIHIPVRPAG